MRNDVFEAVTEMWRWCCQLPWDEITFSEWIQIILGMVSLLITVVLTIVIFKMQCRHERDTERLEQNRIQSELSNRADRFLIDNEAERDYLPWCVLASNLHRHDKHTRKIYTDFCRCSDELQNEILKKANFSFHTISDREWVTQALNSLNIDIENHQLGRNILYDGAKYFFRGYERYREEKWNNLDFVDIFDPIVPTLGKKSFFTKEKLSLGDYIVEYFNFRYSEYEPPIFNTNPIPPIDYLCQMINWENAEELTVCAWIMQMVKEICIVIHNIKYTEKRTTAPELEYTDANSETFEDAYYEALQALYNTYYRFSAQESV